jgi:hypothetical protein
MAERDSFLALAVNSQLATATADGASAGRRGDLARSAAYDARAKRLRVELISGVGLQIPVSLVEGLAGAPASALRDVVVAGRGHALHWPKLDLDLGVPMLVAGCFGSRAWMAALAREGGRSTSVAKAEAARRNGRKGGRPGKGSTLVRPEAK